MNEKAEDARRANSRPIPQDGILDEVARAIASSGHIPTGRLEVSTADGVVQLRGRVRSYYQKQIAQTLALNVIGSRRLVNDIEVT